MDITTFLSEFGLDSKEVKVYLACLELGETTIVPIVHHASLPRTTVYHILERLKERGIVEIIQAKSRRLYAPYPPRKILALLNSERQKIDSTINDFEKALPGILEHYKFSLFEPVIRFFRNREIRQIYEEMLNAPVDEILYISHLSRNNRILGEKYIHEWVKRRIEKKIWSKAIWMQSDVEMLKRDPFFLPSRQNLRSARYAPKDFSTDAHIIIYGDNVGFITMGRENIGLLITSRDIAGALRNCFHQLWKVSTPLPKTK